MAKPILIVKISPNDFKDKDVVDSLIEAIKTLDDYYSFLISDASVGDGSMQFEGVYPQDFNPIEVEELKKKILNA